MRAVVGILLVCVTVCPADEPKGKPNRLAKAFSPYLLQHAHNPVDWHPWGPEAFAKAKAENKLVFLSIGYSACHWCHVMERESFSDPEIAALMNKHFVCIKVDREERPDVDEVYMAALQVTEGGGGWPLSMFLTPAGKPIFGGTYWPPRDKQVNGRTLPGFLSVLNRVVELTAKDRKGLETQADKVAEAVAADLERSRRVVNTPPLDHALASAAADAFEFDPENGGFKSRNAKFPRPTALGFLLHQSTRPGGERFRQPVAHTLERMAAGGLFDHLGGGFHRYTVEPTWTVPHFEKMLYDQAQLVELYAEAFKADPKPLYRRAIVDTLSFVKRELTAPDGGFYAALDADSEGREGAFYVWTRPELDAVLGTEPGVEQFRRVFSLDRPNFEENYHILRLSKPFAELAVAEKLSEEELLAALAPLKAKLFAAREKRSRPFRDTKVLAGWTGLMIAGYAHAGEVLKEPGYAAAAVKGADFLLAKMTDKDGRLMRVWAAAPGEQPQARGPAFLEDYAQVAHGLLALHDATGDAKWLAAARKVTDAALTWHQDDKRGGFYTTANDHEKLFARGKDHYDGATPSGNGLTARNLIRLWAKTKDDRYKAAAERTLAAVAPVLRLTPTAAPVTADAVALWTDAVR
ncbi:MAG: thioredoxin domain-containing protein [Gemmataceae bacterium]